MLNLCQYKNILGEPNKGFHKARLFGFASNDVVGTIMIAIIISYLYKYPFIVVLLILFLVAQILHWMFCVDTQFIKLLQ